MSERDTLCETSPMSDYARRQFETAGIADIAARVAQGDGLAPENAERLNEAPLPLVAKLVSLQPGFELCDRPAVDPVVYLPLAEWTESGGSAAAISKATEKVHEAASQLAELIEQDERVRQFGDCVRILHVVVDSRDDSLRGLSQAVAEALTHGPWHTDISVVFTGPLDQETANDSQAAAAMRAIAVARLTSEHSEIRAPVGRLGINAAHVALSFGANHLGEVALNGETAAALQIPTLAELSSA